MTCSMRIFYFYGKKVKYTLKCWGSKKNHAGFTDIPLGAPPGISPQDTGRFFEKPIQKLYQNCCWLFF